MAQLESDPACLSDAIYDSASDQWSAPIDEHGLMLYAVVHEPTIVIVLRLIAF